MDKSGRYSFSRLGLFVKVTSQLVDETSVGMSAHVLEWETYMAPTCRVVFWPVGFFQVRFFVPATCVLFHILLAETRSLNSPCNKDDCARRVVGEVKND